MNYIIWTCRNKVKYMNLLHSKIEYSLNYGWQKLFESEREWNSERERERCTTKQVWNCVILINYAPGFISNIIK